MAISDKEPEWCPTQSGRFVAYEPEYLNDKGEWKIINTTHSDKRGVPYPRMNGGLNMQIGLFGKEQAEALAWGYAAFAAAEGHHIEVRVQQYEVRYDIKARKVKEVEDV